MIYTLLSEMHAQDKRFEATLLRSSWKMDRFENKMILYRPVGLQEMALIYDSGMKAFPARLPQQPIFYPVLQLEYARQTASDWNAQNGQFAGYVTQFKVEDEYISTFEEHAVGESQHQELWIPAEEVEEFNRQIIGHIKVLEAHFGDAFQGFVPEQFGLQGKNAVEQFTLLANSFLYKRMDFYLEIKRNHKAVFLNYPFWQTYQFKNPGLKEKILQAIKEAWLTSFPKIPLPLPVPVREDTPLAERRQEQTLVDPDKEELTPVEETDSHGYPPPHRVREDMPPIEKSYSYSLIKSIDEEITPVEQADSPTQDLVEPVHEDAPPAEQTDANAQALVNPVQEGTTPAKRPYSHSLIKPVQADLTPAEQSGSSAHFVGTRVHENRALPRQTGAHFMQGIQLGLSGKYHEAIDELSRAVEEDPDHVGAWASLGLAFHRLGEDDRALACYEGALKIDPKSAEAHYFRANIFYSQGNTREAVAGYTMAIGLKPELIEAHEKPAPQDRLTDYGPVPAEMRWIARPAHRILALNKLLEANPRQANLFKERAAAYSRLWNYEQSIADYSSLLAIQPDDEEALHLRGVAYEQLGQSERALEDFQRAIRLNPQISDVYLHRGVIFGQMGNFRQSILSLTEGIRLAPKNPDGYFNRGTTYFQLGDFEKAIADFSLVIQLASNDEAAYYWRGISNEEAGRRGEAIADYRQFLALSQDENARAEIEQRLSQWDEGRGEDPGSVRNLLNNLIRRVRDRSGVPDDRQNTNEVAAEKPGRVPDVYDLISALGERGLHSSWFGSNVECYGEKAEELYAFAEQDEPIDGRDLLSITSGIQQTRAGDFYAFDPGASTHWLFLRAWEGTGFYIETSDTKSKERLKAQFPSVEEVDGVPPPYAGLFFRI